MRDLSANILEWAEARERGVVAELYSLIAPDGTPYRYVAGDPLGAGGLTFDGNFYTAAAITRDQEERTLGESIPNFRINISNVNGFAGSIIQQNDLEGQNITITFVLLETLDPDDSFSEDFEIQETAFNNRVATFVVGTPNFFTYKVSRFKYTRLRCQWDYENRSIRGNGCSYPSDNFISTEQRISQPSSSPNSSDARRRALYGWEFINFLSSGGFVNVPDVFVPGGVDFGLRLSQNGNFRWAPGQLEAPYFFKPIFGSSFDVRTKVTFGSPSPGITAGFLCQVEDASRVGTDNWVVWAREIFDDGNDTVVIRADSALSGVLTESTAFYFFEDEWIRLKRTASTFELYSSPVEDPAESDWVLRDTRTVALNSNRTRVGFYLQSQSAGFVSATFKEFYAPGGGLETCTRTITGDNGCLDHGNLHRRLAFPTTQRR